MPPHIASAAPSALAQAPPRNVAVPPFAEASADPAAIGTRPGGRIIMQPTPGQALHAAFAAELRHAGDTIASGAGVTIEGKVTAFGLRVSQTSFGWQVVLESGLAVSAHSDTKTVNHAYTTRCGDRSYSAPGADLIAGVIRHCVDDLALQFSIDADIAHVLGAP